MWIWIANKFAKFHAKRLHQSENIQKVLGGYFFETPGIYMNIHVCTLKDTVCDVTSCLCAVQCPCVYEYLCVYEY